MREHWIHERCCSMACCSPFEQPRNGQRQHPGLPKRHSGAPRQPCRVLPGAHTHSSRAPGLFFSGKCVPHSPVLPYLSRPFGLLHSPARLHHVHMAVSACLLGPIACLPQHVCMMSRISSGMPAGGSGRLLRAGSAMAPSRLARCDLLRAIGRLRVARSNTRGSGWPHSDESGWPHSDESGWPSSLTRAAGD